MIYTVVKFRKELKGPTNTGPELATNQLGAGSE